MNREKLDALLAEIRALREQTLAELNDMTEAEFPNLTGMERWTEARRVLLRFGDHMREHATQVAGIRAALDRDPTMPQRMLAEAEIAWGVLLAATVGLTDDDLDAQPDEGWSVLQTLEHIRESERDYLEAMRRARAQGES